MARLGWLSEETLCRAKDKLQVAAFRGPGMDHWKWRLGEGSAENLVVAHLCVRLTPRLFIRAAQCGLRPLSYAGGSYPLRLTDDVMDQPRGPTPPTQAHSRLGTVLPMSAPWGRSTAPLPGMPRTRGRVARWVILADRHRPHTGCGRLGWCHPLCASRGDSSRQAL